MNNSSKQYKAVIEYALTSGKRLTKRAGKIQDIGITKTDLTEEDLAIERGFKKLIENFGRDYVLYAEEENSNLLSSENVWIVDPISGTNTFISGLGHYAIVAAHLYKNQVVFAVIYDPSVNELFTAYHDKGAYLNGKKISVSQFINKRPKIVFNRSKGWKEPEIARKSWITLDELGNVFRNTNSFAINYCHVACGRYDGVFTLSKDSFPEHAGSLIIKEAGGVFTNNKKTEQFHHEDRVFLGGNKTTYELLSKNFNF